MCSRMMMAGIGFASLVSSATPAALAQKPAIRVESGQRTAGGEQEDAVLKLLLQQDLIASTLKRPFTSSQEAMIDSALRVSHPGRVHPGAWFSAKLNSQRPFSENDGVVWAGRGLTAAGSAGVEGHVGPISYAARPIAFLTQNASVARAVVLQTGSSEFGNQYVGQYIDAPLQFGPHAYARLDPGESFVRLQSRWIEGGFSSAARTWGPAHLFPLLLSANAGGFPHAFAETALPWNVGAGKLSAIWFFGVTRPSAFAPLAIGDSSANLSAAMFSFTPRGMRGLELGAGRVFHLRRGRGPVDLKTLTLPFSHVFKHGLAASIDSANAGEYNQLASAFFRLAPTASGFELYGEYLREDHSWDKRDILSEPDHASGFMVGFRRIWSAEGSARVLTMEMLNGRLTHLVRVRGESPLYIHTTLPEGHTSNGQFLGAPALFGGGGMRVVLDRYRAGARWSTTLAVEHTGQDGEGGTWQGTPTGFVDLGLARTLPRGSIDRTLGLRIQPGFGYEHGVNVVIEGELRWSGMNRR